jgi:hypothetical protein
MNPAQKAVGETHRKVIRDLVFLQGGQPLPSGNDLGWLLGINAKEAQRHLKLAMAQDGRAVVTMGRGRNKRLYLEVSHE